MFHFHRSLVALSILWAAVVVVSTHAQNVSNTTDVTFASLDEIIAADDNLTSFHFILTTANINLTDTFDDTVTVFAPINSAFTAYNEILQTYADVQYVAHLQNLLWTHVVEAELLSTDFMDGQTFLAANNESITVMIDNINTSTVTIFTADSNATVVAADLFTNDGILHQIDGVLIPAFLNIDLLNLTKSISGFSIFHELLEFTGLWALVGSDLTATLFAPTDEAFLALPEGALEYYRSTISVATKLLSGHVISPLILPTQNMVNSDITTETPAGTTLSIEILKVDGRRTYKVNNATIVQENILASNGIIHALDTVLDVPGAEFVMRTTAPTTLPTTTPVRSGPTTLPTTKPSSEVPIAMPVRSITNSPIATANVNVVIENVQITLRGASTMPTTDVTKLQSIMEEWFESYFNDRITETRQRHLLLEPTRKYRNLQQQQIFRVPEVLNMKTLIDVTAQDTLTASGSNTITYTQNLVYDATNDARDPKDYTLFPFVDTAYRNDLLNRIQTNITSLSDVTTVSSPVVVEPPQNEDVDSDSGGLSLAGTIGIVVGGCVVGILIVVYVGYVIMKQKSTNNTATTNTRVIDGNPTATTHHEHPPTITPPVLAADAVPTTTTRNEFERPVYIPTATIDTRWNDHHHPTTTTDQDLNYKDQARSVNCPIANAIPE